MYLHAWFVTRLRLIIVTNDVTHGNCCKDTNNTAQARPRSKLRKGDFLGQRIAVVSSVGGARVVLLEDQVPPPASLGCVV